MAIKYDGIVFESVKELVEYKKAMENDKDNESKEEPVGKMFPEKKIEQVMDNEIYLKAQILKELREVKRELALKEEKVTKRYKNKGVINIIKTNQDKHNRPWSKEDDEILTKFMRTAKLSKEGYIKRGQLKRMARKLGRTIPALSHRANRIGVRPAQLGRRMPSTKAKAIQKEEDEHNEYMIRKAPKKVLTKAQELMGLATKMTEPREFPMVYPIHDKHSTVFEMCVNNLISNKSTMTYHEVMSSFELADNGDWNGRYWGMFVRQFMMNSGKLSDYFGVKNKFKIIKQGGYDVIKYG